MNYKLLTTVLVVSLTSISCTSNSKFDKYFKNSLKYWEVNLQLSDSFIEKRNQYFEVNYKEEIHKLGRNYCKGLEKPSERKDKLAELNAEMDKLLEKSNSKNRSLEENIKVLNEISKIRVEALKELKKRTDPVRVNIEMSMKDAALLAYCPNQIEKEYKEDKNRIKELNYIKNMR